MNCFSIDGFCPSVPFLCINGHIDNSERKRAALRQLQCKDDRGLQRRYSTEGRHIVKHFYPRSSAETAHGEEEGNGEKISNAALYRKEDGGKAYTHGKARDGEGWGDDSLIELRQAP